MHVAAFQCSCPGIAAPTSASEAGCPLAVASLPLALLPAPGQAAAAAVGRCLLSAHEAGVVHDFAAGAEAAAVAAEKRQEVC